MPRMRIPSVIIITAMLLSCGSSQEAMFRDGRPDDPSVGAGSRAEAPPQADEEGVRQGVVPDDGERFADAVARASEVSVTARYQTKRTSGADAEPHSEATMEFTGSWDEWVHVVVSRSEQSRPTEFFGPGDEERLDDVRVTSDSPGAVSARRADGSYVAGLLRSDSQFAPENRTQAESTPFEVVRALERDLSTHVDIEITEGPRSDPEVLEEELTPAQEWADEVGVEFEFDGDGDLSVIPDEFSSHVATPEVPNESFAPAMAVDRTRHDRNDPFAPVSPSAQDLFDDATAADTDSVADRLELPTEDVVQYAYVDGDQCTDEYGCLRYRVVAYEPALIPLEIASYAPDGLHETLVVSDIDVSTLP